MNPTLLAHVERRRVTLGRVRRVLIDSLHVPREPDEIDADAPLFGTGLGLDSVDAVELVVSLEAEFGLTLPDDSGRTALRTLNTVVDLVLSRAGAADVDD